MSVPGKVWTQSKATVGAVEAPRAACDTGAVAALVEGASAGVLPASGLLEDNRAKWRQGAWAELTLLREQDIVSDPDRGKLALLVAAAQSHEGDMRLARHYLRLAADWGCESGLISRVMISAVHNTLGRASVCLDEEQAAVQHFETAIGLVEAGTDAILTAQTRRVRETARMGLLPDAARLLEAELASLAAAPADIAARLAALKSEVQLLNHELVLALQRKQIYVSADDRGPDAPTHDLLAGLKDRAVSQLGQDLWVLERTGYKRGGYFVEFGATDGIALSNTYLLEREFGWTGICAEPNPEFFARLQQNRSCITSPACIAGESGTQVDFILADVYGCIAGYADGDKHAGIREAYRADRQVTRLTTVSLSDLLAAHGAPKTIDFLSIDTEGSEFEILNAFPFDQWTIKLITVEHNFTPAREDIRKLLEGQGYQRTEMRFDDWYELVK